jgi:carbamoyl-phosphate synthase large subunit
LKATVLVTASGSIVGEGIIKCLKVANSSSTRISYHIIAGDMSAEGAGLYRGNEGVIVPPFNDPRYIDELIRHCKEHSVQAIYVGADEELLVLAKASEIILKASGARLISNPEGVIETAGDKWKAAELMISKGIRHALTALYEKREEFVRENGYPLVVKPRSGHGSTDVFVAKTSAEMEASAATIRRNNREPILQEFLEGENQEFTTGVSLSQEGKILASIAMRRKLKHGQTYKAFVDDFPLVRDSAEKAALAIGGRGPINVQSRVVKDEAVIFEINPRFSASCPIRAIAGINEPDLIYRNQLLGEEVSIRNYEKLVALRYWNEVYVRQDAFEAASRGNVHGDKSFIPDYF